MSTKAKSVKSKSVKSAAVAAKKPALVLTKPKKGGSLKASTADKLIINGFEKKIVEMRERQKRIDSDSAAQKKDKEALVDSVGKTRLDEEKAGNFHKTVLVASADDKPGQVIFADKYSKIDVEHEKALRDGLEGQYDVLVARGLDIKLGKGTTLETLKKALGPKGFAALTEVADLTEYLTFSSAFREKRSALRSSMSDETNEFVDGLIEQAQYSPSVKLK